jgi:hypothetical protein
MGNYPTLRRGITHPSNVNERSLHDLPTVLCNTTVAHEEIRKVLGVDVIPQRLQGLVVPNCNYLEYLMGYPKDWTKVEELIVYKPTTVATASATAAATAAAVATATATAYTYAFTDADADASQLGDMDRMVDTNANANAKISRARIAHIHRVQQPRPKNGMHLFMKDNPGKDVRQVAILWRELAEDIKSKYKNLAADLAVDFYKAAGIEQPKNKHGSTVDLPTVV